MTPLSPAGAAWGLCKDHDVLDRRPRELQFKPQPPVNAAEAQGLNRVRAKRHRHRRPEQPVAANTSPGAVNPYEMLLPGQRTPLTQSPATQDVRRRRGPGFPLLVRQDSTVGLGECAESFAGASGGGIAHVLGNDVRALALPVPDHEEDDVAAPATFRAIQNVHLHNSQVFIAALTDRLGVPV
jgi:hypothetical protein